MISIARRRIPLLNGDGRGIIDGYEYVDLGLPSGLKWATCNVRATTETKYGLYFSWGETTGYGNAILKTNRGATGFTWGSYKYITGTSGQASALTKYNSTDGKTVLDLTDDAAHVIMGGDWRMPTIEEYEELIDNTTNTWVTNYNGTGVNGRLFTSKTNPNIKLFFPAAGNCEYTTVYSTGYGGYYWSSSLSTRERLYGRDLYFYSSSMYTGNFNRSNGQSVRGVRSA